MWLRADRVRTRRREYSAWRGSSLTVVLDHVHSQSGFAIACRWSRNYAPSPRLEFGSEELQRRPGSNATSVRFSQAVTIPHCGLFLRPGCAGADRRLRGTGKRPDVWLCRLRGIGIAPSPLAPLFSKTKSNTSAFRICPLRVYNIEIKFGILQRGEHIKFNILYRVCFSPFFFSLSPPARQRRHAPDHTPQHLRSL